MPRRDDIYYDLEGPASSLDHAQFVCKRLVRDGGKLFPVISRYDDLLTLANREGYEPGDTLGLIIPFLLEASVTEYDLQAVSSMAGLVLGLEEFFTELHKTDCRVSFISTSYQQHALSIAERVGVPPERVYCTKFPLDQLRREIDAEDLVLVRGVREGVVKLYLEDLESGESDKAMLSLLDYFYWKALPKTKLGQAMTKVTVMGGRRKVRALQDAIRANGGYYLSDAIVVVDSITDWRMAQAVEAAGGVAVAWNANWYALPYCSCGIAAVDARGVQPLFRAWQKGGRAAVREFVESASLPENPNIGPYYHWLAGRDEKFQREMLTIHRRLRTACRGEETAKLG